MSLQAPVDDLASLSNGALMRLLEKAHEDERFLSAERRTLHQQLDEPDVAADSGAARLVALQAAERTISERRLELHQWLIELRMERGRRVSGLRRHLEVVS